MIVEIINLDSDDDSAPPAIKKQLDESSPSRQVITKTEQPKPFTNTSEFASEAKNLVNVLEQVTNNRANVRQLWTQCSKLTVAFYMMKIDSLTFDTIKRWKDVMTFIDNIELLTGHDGISTVAPEWRQCRSFVARYQLSIAKIPITNKSPITAAKRDAKLVIVGRDNSPLPPPPSSKKRALSISSISIVDVAKCACEASKQVIELCKSSSNSEMCNEIQDVGDLLMGLAYANAPGSRFNVELSRLIKLLTDLSCNTTHATSCKSIIRELNEDRAHVTFIDTTHDDV